MRSIRKLEPSDVILGQCTPTPGGKGDTKLEKATPTFFAAALYIDNARWDGVPFLIKVGRGLIKHRLVYCFPMVVFQFLLKTTWVRKNQHKEYML